MSTPIQPNQPKTSFYAVVGSDEGLVREKALALYNQLTHGVDDGFTHETIDGVSDNSESASQIISLTIQALQTLSMFGGDKVVWLRNANFFGDSVTGRSKQTEAAVEALKSTLENGLNPGVSFILSATDIDKRRAFWKFVEKNASVTVFDSVDTSKDDWHLQVKPIVKNLAAPFQLSFTPDALDLFILLAGEKSQQIQNELTKLDLFLGPDRRTITEEDVTTLVPFSRDALVFEIGKAIQAGNASKAIKLVDEQLMADESPIGIMRASIIPTLRNLYLARLIIEQFKPPANCSYNQFTAAINKVPEADRSWLPQKKDGSGVNVYPIYLAAATAQKFTLQNLFKVLDSAHQADIALVTSSLDPRVIIHRLLIEIAAARS